MEFKKKTIIWEDNNEPPKDYIWIKSDGKAYEYSYSQRKWIESKSISGSGNSESVEANPTIEDGDVTTPLNALKIGESVYTVEGNSDSEIQIVELTYDHLPATGTLSASDLAKLDSDNCLLVMNGKYFRKTFSSSGGIDYKEISLTTVLGGVRSIYFTASKPDGEYTIAYTYPIEANTQTQPLAVLENIKVGNTTYSVPLAPMIVEGTFDENGYFTPGEGTASWSDAHEQMFNGGLLYLVATEDGEPVVVFLAAFANPVTIGAPTDEGFILWPNPDSEGGDDYEPQTYTIQGTVNSNKEFTANVLQMPYGEAKQHYDNGDTIILQFTALATGVTLNETVVSWTDGNGATTTNGFTWLDAIVM